MSHINVRNFVFRHVYENAALIEAAVGYPDSFYELDWSGKEVQSCLFRFQKISILHYYIYSIISSNYRYEYRHNDDIYEESEDSRYRIEETLQAYGIPFLPYNDFIQLFSNRTENDYFFYNWFNHHEEQFKYLWAKMTDEVFHLLFANRAFLLNFNKGIARTISAGEVQIDKSKLDTNGYLKRQKHFPVWLKKAVFYRDQGKCILCQRDLTGLISTDVQVHYDHIVPLKLWGINDPCNIQTLCADCNLKKSGKTGQTAMRYQSWWNY